MNNEDLHLFHQHEIFTIGHWQNAVLFTFIINIIIDTSIDTIIIIIIIIKMYL